MWENNLQENRNKEDKNENKCTCHLEIVVRYKILIYYNFTDSEIILRKRISETLFTGDPHMFI